jgi:8-oxo-dGTP pyrophosphatase MutT (NUDIX family)
MPQKYKVYFANRPVVFTENPPEEVVRTCKVIRSQGKSDTMLIESAIAGGAKEVSLCCANVDGSWESFCNQFELVRAAGGLILNAKKEMLFIYRLGKWDLPKGKVEDGEDEREGAVREVEEECNVRDARIIRFLLTTWHTYIQKGEPILKSTHWYLMETGSFTILKPQQEEGITEVKWFAPDNLQEVRANTYPSVLDVINAYISG